MRRGTLRRPRNCSSARRHTRLPMPPLRDPGFLRGRGLCLRGSSSEIARGLPLRIDPDERRRASALLAAKTDVADEGVPADSPALEQQGEREVGDPAAAAGQPQERVALIQAPRRTGSASRNRVLSRRIMAQGCTGGGRSTCHPRIATRLTATWGRDRVGGPIAGPLSPLSEQPRASS